MTDPLEASTLTWEGDAACPLTVLTVATRMEAGAHNMLASLRRYGYKYRVLGWGEPWKGWRQRMAWYRDSAREYPPNQLLVYVDAYDIVAARPFQGIAEAFAQVAGGVGLVLGMEALCCENCGHIGPWWSQAKTKGRTPTSLRKYLNGGMVMGRASAIADAYDWVLKDARHFTDDQIGLAAYINAHPATFAPDDGSVLIHNIHAMQHMSASDGAGTGAFFLHYPGVNKIPPAFPIAEAWRAHSGRLAVLRMPTSPIWEQSKVILWIGVPLLLLAIGLALGVVLGRRFPGAPKLAHAPAPATAPASAPTPTTPQLSDLGARHHNF